MEYKKYAAHPLFIYPEFAIPAHKAAQFCEAEKRSPHIKKLPSAPASAMTRHSMKAA